jgi:hypothetical protein
MKNKILTLVLLFSMITVSRMWAQNLPGSIWTSPQSATTEGRYRSNTDDFIRPDNYAGVRFDKWFSMVSFINKTVEGADTGAIATAGFATRVNNIANFGSIYIAGFYSGDFWTSAPAGSYTEKAFTEASAPDGGTANKTYKVYSSINVVPAPVNNFALLVGAADMGFRFTYRTSHQSFDKSNIVTEGRLYKNYQAAGGYIAPQIAWAMAKNLTPNGIRPYITLDLVFNRDYLKTETAAGVQVGRSLNQFDPSLAAGMGGYTFYNKDGFRFSADADYVLTMKIYNNEYSYLDGDKYKTGKINGTYSPGSNPYLEKSYVSNMITPSVSGQWSVDRLALRFKLNLPLTLVFEEQSSMGQDASGKLINNGPNESSSAFTFRPDLRLAMQYRIIQDRLTLNAGARIQATSITLRTINQKNYVDGNVISSAKVHETTFADNSGGGSRFVSRFSIGVTCNLTKNAWLEANTGVSNIYGDNAIDVFASGGLFSFGSIMVGLKF